MKLLVLMPIGWLVFWLSLLKSGPNVMYLYLFTEVNPLWWYFRSKHPKTVLIMDEVDGMSAGDRGGIADLIASIKISKIPIICICNDRYSQKLKSLVNYCLLLSYRKPTKQQVCGFLGWFGFLCFLCWIWAPHILNVLRAFRGWVISNCTMQWLFLLACAFLFFWARYSYYQYIWLLTLTGMIDGKEIDASCKCWRTTSWWGKISFYC